MAGGGLERPGHRATRESGYPDPADTATWKAGEQLLLSGKLLTGRDAAHKKLADLVKNGQPLPVDFHNRFIYYVGPVDAVRDEAVGPAGPTTATRMDKFTDLMLGETGGPARHGGKSERGPEAIASIKAHAGVYCIAVGGAAYLVPRPSRRRRCWPSRNWAWKRSTSSRWRTCRSPWRWTAPAIRCTTRARGMADEDRQDSALGTLRRELPSQPPPLAGEEHFSLPARGEGRGGEAPLAERPYFFTTLRRDM
jgi:tartrate/fumarate subfamily iron-sulfur-dependent hydro-lyase beta chain